MIVVINKMVVLGIDPGTAICGYGLIELVEGQLNAIKYGAITTSAKTQMQNRLEKIYNSVDELIKEYQPELIGVEKLYFGRNATTAIPVGQARGVVLLAAAKNCIELVERTPNEIKQSVTGYGGASKEQVIYMVTKLLKLDEEPKPDDVADALAVAICTLHTTDNFLWNKNN